MFSRVKTLVSSLGTVFKALRKNGKPNRRTFMRARPALEPLEDRLSPAIWWGSPSDSNWSTPSNWSTNSVPAASETAILDGDVSTRPATVDPGFHGTLAQVIIQSDYSSQITMERSLTVTGKTDQSSGTIFGSHSWITPSGGTYEWKGGVLRGFGNPFALTVIQSGATMVITAQTAFLDGRTIENQGTISWTGGLGMVLTIDVKNVGKISNLGTFSVTTQGIYLFNGDGSGTFSNGGVFQIANLATVDFLNAIKVTSAGSFNLLGANSNLRLFAETTLPGGAQILGAGTCDVYGEIKLPGGTATTKAWTNAKSGSLFSGSGVFKIENANLVNQGATIDGAEILVDPLSTMDITGNLTLSNAGHLRNDGTVVWSSGTITLQHAVSKITNQNAGIFSVLGQGNLTMTGAGFFVNSAATGTGRMEVVQGANTLTISNPFTNIAKIWLSSGTLIVPSNWSQSGQVQFMGGNLRVPNTFTNSGTVVVLEDGRLETDLFQNNGTLDMIDQDHDTLTIARLPGAMTGGGYTQGMTGALLMEITGDLTNDVLNIAGAATLTALLDVRLGNNYQPGGPLPRTWTLLFHGSRTGQFTAVNKPLRFDFPVYGNLSTTITWRPA